MKKAIVLLLAVVLALSFAACGKKEVSTDGDVTITWIIPGDKQTDTASVAEKASEITMDKLGVKLDIQFLDTAAFTERMNMKYASSADDFDLTFTGYINPYRDAALKGAYYEISEFVEKSDIIKEAIPEYARLCSMINGELYGLPNMQIMATTTGLFIKKDLAEEYGLKVEDIKKLEDIEPFLEWVKNNHSGIYPFKTLRYDGGTRNQVYGDTVTNCVKVVDDGNGEIKVVTPLDGEAYGIEETVLMRSWYEKGYIRADVASVGDETAELNAGKYAVWRGTYKPGGNIEHNTNYPNNECIMIQISEPYLPYNAGATTMTAINANSKHPEEAFKVYELMHSDKELYNLICYGIEGKHYNLDDDGAIVAIADSGYQSIGSWKVGSVFNSYLLPGQAKDLWTETIALNDSAIKSPIMGFSFDPEAVKTEIAQILTVESKFRQGGTGVEPLEKWRPTYLEELEKAGIEKVAAEVEKQIKQWQKQNK